MTQQQEMWYRRNLARRQAMIAAVTRMMYSAQAGGSSSGSAAPAEEEMTVPSIPAPEETMYYFSDGTVSSIAELDEWIESSGASEEEQNAKMNDVGKVVVGADMMKDLGYSLRLSDEPL